MKKLSFFADFYSMAPSEKTLEDIYQIIRSDSRSQSVTAAYRSTHDKRIKESSYTFSVAVVFKDGKGKNQVAYFTGIALVDLDHVPLDQLAHVKQLICQDPHTLLCYTTISGEGLRILYRYEMLQDASLEQQAKFYILPFMTGNHYYEQLTHQKPDPLCKNATRLSGIGYDPEAYYNPDAIAFKREEIMQQSETVRKENKSEKSQKRIQTYFDNFIKPRLLDEGIVFEHGSHNEYVMRTGYMLADKGYNKTETLKWAKKVFKEYADTETVMKSCFNGSTHTHEGNRSPIATVQEIEDYLSEHIQLHITSPREHPFAYRGIYAQAYRLYKEGFRYWFSTEEIVKVNQRNKDFEVPHAEQELVETYFRKPTADEAGEFISSSRALQMIGGNITQKLSLPKISQAFVELGFERKRHNGIRGFIAVERTGEEIKSYLKRCATMPPCHEVL